MTRPVLFIAREPDETLRTFLPVIDALRDRDVPASVAFHHWPGPWAQRGLTERSVPWWLESVPERALPRWLPERLVPGRLLPMLAEIWQLRQTQALAGRLVRKVNPSAVVVIQDTLLLERFVVRWANRQRIPTLVIQWAFNFPQDYYDRLRAIRSPKTSAPPPAARSKMTSRIYHRLLRALDVEFDLANSYGGGEASRFAVMGEHFASQYQDQGVPPSKIIVTGHPLQDAAFRRAHVLSDETRNDLRESYGIRDGEHVVLYATQPFFWRGVISPEQLEENVAAMNRATVALGDEYRLTVKIHPRESAEDYSFCARLAPPVRVIAQAEMTDLIALADVFVSSSSSTVLLAMMLDRPIITVNFNNVLHFDFFESIGGTMHVRTHEAFADALQQVVHDEAKRRELAENRSKALGRLTRFDGQATERIADILAPANMVGVAAR